MRRIQRKKASERIREAMAVQMDVLEIVRWFRIFTFQSMVSLGRGQAELVQYFSAYSLNHEGEKIQ